MAMRTKRITLGPTNASGDFSVDVVLPGLVKAVGVVIGTLSTPDVTITDKLTGGAIFAKAGIAADGVFQPKAVAVSTAAAALNTAGDVAFESPSCLQTMHIVVAGGGDTKTGSLYVQVES